VKYLQALLSRPEAPTKNYDASYEPPTKLTELPTKEVPSVLSVSPRGTEKTAEAGEAAVGPVRHVAEALLFLDMRLGVFARDGRPLELRVSWWPVTLFFVPDQYHAQALCSEGIKRERIWTAGELLNLLRGSSYAPEALRMIMVARREFGGEVVQVLRGGEEAA
jgi:hypothetical protein